MKDRVTYASRVLYVGPTGVAGSLGESPISGITPTQLHHVNYVEHSIEAPTETAYQFGTLTPMGEAMVKPIDVKLDFEYNLADLQNEKWLGFTVDNLSTSSISGFLDQKNDEQNFYVLTSNSTRAIEEQSQSEFLNNQENYITSFGNCVVESYKIGASLSSVPSASISMDATTIYYSKGVSGIIKPSVDQNGKCWKKKEDIPLPQTLIIPKPEEDRLNVDSLRPAYIDMYFSSESCAQGGYVLPTGSSREDSLSSCSLTSFEIELDLPRRKPQRLGSKFPLSKKIKYPAFLRFSCVARAKDLKQGEISNMFCTPESTVTIEMDNPYNLNKNIIINLKGMHLESEISQTSLMNQETVNLEFSCALSSPTGDNYGMYISGVAAPPQLTSYGITSGQFLGGDLAYR
jgi:hypothetical protein